NSPRKPVSPSASNASCAATGGDCLLSLSAFTLHVIFRRSPAGCQLTHRCSNRLKRKNCWMTAILNLPPANRKKRYEYIRFRYRQRARRTRAKKTGESLLDLDQRWVDLFIVFRCLRLAVQPDKKSGVAGGQRTATGFKATTLLFGAAIALTSYGLFSCFDLLAR